METLQDMGIVMPVLVVGFEDEFTEHGDPQKLMQQYGLTAPGIQKRIEACWPELKAIPSFESGGLNGCLDLRAESQNRAH
jgi:1-deoxy-D-xylulose-5-phosphate synthase